MSDLDSSDRNPDHDLCAVICPISAAMIGVCLTTIGLIRVVISLDKADTLADDLLSADALIFLLATVVSYRALRVRAVKRLHGMERLADFAFSCRIGADGDYLPVHHLSDRRLIVRRSHARSMRGARVKARQRTAKGARRFPPPPQRVGIGQQQRGG